MAWDESYDLVIAGSGGGAFCAALASKAAGKSSVILEKQWHVGGSTAYSGGILWIAANRFLSDRDSIERARTYMDGLIGNSGPASNAARREAYLLEGRKMLAFLEAEGMRFAHAYWPDYYSSEPGGLEEGRSLIAPLFDINALGEWGDRLGRFSGYPPFPVGSEEAATLSLAARTWKGRMTALRLGTRMLRQKLTGARLRGAGTALQGRMLQILLRHGLVPRCETPVVDLISKDGRVVGVVARSAGRDIRIEARDGVLLDTGGFSHNDEMRRTYQPALGTVQWALPNPGDTGEAIQMAMRLGAAIDLMDEAWWTPSSFDGGGCFVGFHVPTDTAKPHSIVVDGKGRRFANESGSYMEFGQCMLAAGAVPAWAILESRNRSYYPWGLIPPGRTPRREIDSGYIIEGNTIRELAHKIDIDPDSLAATISRFNGFAARGVDEEFGRGHSAYNRSMGDPRIKPNPCLGAIERPPFYAVRLFPADVGTSGGLVTDEHARVVRVDGGVIEGLFATGNCTASVMGRRYPGAGASIGASFTFGYIGARYATGVQRSQAA